MGRIGRGRTTSVLATMSWSSIGSRLTGIGQASGVECVAPGDLGVAVRRFTMETRPRKACRRTPVRVGLGIVHEIEVDELALFARIENRASERRRTGTARSDDSAEILRRRLTIYRENSAPVLPYYRAKGLLRSVDGMVSIEGVATQIDNLLG